MQNCYVGDIGDFGKYLLLNYLCAHENVGIFPFRLGVVWFKVPNGFGQNTKQKSNDGKHIKYLEASHAKSEEFRKWNLALYENLHQIVCVKKQRDMVAIREMQILCPETIYCEEELSFSKEVRKEQRRAYWNDYITKAIDKTKECDIIFFDPDNGIEIPSVKKDHLYAPKYVYYDDLERFFKRQQSLVIYHHICRNGKAKDQIRTKMIEIASKLGCQETCALWYHGGTARAFFVIPSKKHKKILLNRTKKFLEPNNPWIISKYFEHVPRDV
jgi:hypothetical protein